MLRGLQQINTLFTILVFRELNCEQLCNLGKSHLNNTSISSIYVGTGDVRLIAENAFNGQYSDYIPQCAGTQPVAWSQTAWWQVTFKSLSMIFKINLIFREEYSRHEKYYVFITNETVSPEELNTLNPVYHDGHVKPSYQNTIVFPGGHQGLQVYILVNRTVTDEDHGNYVELCEAEVYGCIHVTYEEAPGCKCRNGNTTMDDQNLVLWDSRIAFGNGNVTLQCYKDYLSIMNLISQTESELESILEACDGKQQCTIPTSQNLKDSSISFYCTDRCVNEAYNNTIPVSQLMTDSGLRYHTDVMTEFSALFKSRELNCSDRHVLTKGNLTLQCQREGQWIGEAPVCNITCQEPIHDNSTTIRHTHPSPNYFVDYSVTYTCRKNHRIVKGNLTRVCNKRGDWTEDKPVCKRCKCPCERLKSQNFITDPQELHNRIKEIEKELEINKKALSATVRKKTCAKDERKSAKGIGSVLGIGIIVFVVSIIVCSDIPMLYRHIRYGP
ncbi:uncharacterized protein LOC128167874 [Crassostrea angulata]|uniref:uncharacterized protein LOC128167874 n=1 Tax=Magallana angulata TaxID=2784310 RepID=UPI0022B16A0C|nr:uncharacterized protein LOC128167874 [Crassostrea angulata]